MSSTKMAAVPSQSRSGGEREVLRARAPQPFVRQVRARARKEGVPIGDVIIHALELYMDGGEWVSSPLDGLPKTAQELQLQREAERVAGAAAKAEAREAREAARERKRTARAAHEAARAAAKARIEAEREERAAAWSATQQEWARVREERAAVKTARALAREAAGKRPPGPAPKNTPPPTMVGGESNPSPRPEGIVTRRS